MMVTEHEEVKALLLQAKTRIGEVLEELSDDIINAGDYAHNLEWESLNFKLSLIGKRK